MDPRCREVEREDRNHGEEPFDKPSPALPLYGSCRPVDAMQEFGSGDRGDPDGLLGVRAQSVVEIECPPFGADKDRRIDQRPHGDRGGRPWLRAARRTSEA